MKLFISFFVAILWAVSVPALPPPIQPQQMTTNSGSALVAAAQLVVRTNLALIGGNITGNTNLQVDLYENGGGAGGQRMFSVRDSYGGKLIELNPRATSHSNYWTLFFGDQTTNGIGANLSDVFFMQSAVGYHAFQFGDQTNSFWFTGDSPHSWTAHGGDLGGIGDDNYLFNNYGDLYYHGTHMTNWFAMLSKFNAGQFTANASGINFKNAAVVTNLVSKTTLSTDGNFFVGSDQYAEGTITPFNALTIVADVTADSFTGSGAGLTGIPGSGLQNPLAVTTVNAGSVVVSGTASNSFQINGTNGAMILGINPTNNAVTIGNGGLQPAGVPVGANYFGSVNVMTNLTGPYRAGTTNIGNLATALLVTFTTALPDANYAVGITFDTTLGAAVSAAATSKTASGFTVSLSAGIAGGASLDYIAWPYR